MDSNITQEYVIEVYKLPYELYSYYHNTIVPDYELNRYSYHLFQISDYTEEKYPLLVDWLKENGLERILFHVY